MSRSLALFDFDKTITRTDSMIRFLVHTFGYRRFVQGLSGLSPSIIQYLGRALKNDTMKEITLTRFFKDWPVDKFKIAADNFGINILPRYIRPSALKRIEHHREAGHRIIVVTASVDYWVQPWTDTQEIELIATRIEEKDGIITGRLATPNCYGPEKVRRINEYLDLSEYDSISAYGDSRGDREMLEIAHHQHYRFLKS